MGCSTYDIEIKKGDTFVFTMRWELAPLVYALITNMEKSAPARITAPTHGLPDGWRAAVVDAQGMTELNAKYDPPRSSDFKQVTVVNANVVTLNNVSSLGFHTYTGGGALVYYTPADLAGYTAAMQIKDKVGGTVLIDLSSAGGEIVLDNTAKTITATIDATTTGLIDWTRGVYDMQVELAGVVKTLLMGNVTVIDEVTT